MSIIIIIALFIIVIVATVGITAFFLFRFRRSDQASKTTGPVNVIVKSEKIPFKWNYIMLPIIVLIVAIIISVYYYPRLPGEVALQLNSSDSASRWLSRELILVITIVPQALLSLLGAGIVFLITKLGLLSKQNWASNISCEKLLWLMGNIPAIPQGALCFTMFGIFYYNAYQSQLMPVWLFLVITLGISGAILAVFLIFTFLRIRQKPSTQLDRIEEI